MKYASLLLYLLLRSALIAQAEDPCLSFCKNFGTCVTVNGGPKCECISQFFTGDQCEIDVDACISSPCLNSGNCTDTLTGYDCACQPGYAGRQCHINIDECMSNPCVEGTCTDHVGFYTCDCTYGFTGKDCDVNIDNCPSSACQNGGTCMDGLEEYSCQCADGFGGLTCEVESNCDLSGNTCQNNAICSMVQNITMCECLPGFTGETCGTDINECASNPCQNNATCFNKINNFTCICPDGFSGDRCQDDINECASMPCQNGGICVESGINDFDCFCKQGFTGVFCQININDCLDVSCLYGGMCVDGDNEFTCNCVPGTEGTFCEVVTDPCAILPCANNGTCITQGDNYICECLPNFTGSDCSVELSSCFSQPCQNNATCTPSGDSYECICIPGYTTMDCSIEIDECSTDPCQNGGTCFDLLNDYSCMCMNGYEGSNCETNIDDCSSSPCVNGSCLDQVNGFTCACELGFTGTLCDAETNECDSNPCANGATCIDQINDYVCMCPNGLTGENCNIDIDNCLGNPCENNATCVDILGGYMCLCHPGYTGDHCMIDIVDCVNGVCMNDATCIEGINSYTCVCTEGFTGENCDAEIDFCESNPCFGDSTCESNLSGFICLCSVDYTGDDCSIMVDDCQNNPCKNGGTCEDLVGNFSCSCPNGYTGNKCQLEINECESSPCLNGGNCTDLVANFSCKCPTNYYGKNCQIFSTGCDNITCENGGSCVEQELGFECLCRNGFMGILCETDIDECNDNGCKNGATCMDGIGEFTCICADGYNGTLCEIDTDMCDPQPCQNNGTCQESETGASFNCTCDKNFEGIMCEIPIQNCISSPCKNGGTCQEVDVGGFTCLCLPYYTGSTCEEEVDPCSELPCQNGGLCLPNLLSDIPTYVCNCSNPFIGSNCEMYDPCLETPCLNNGSCYSNLTEESYFCQCDDEYLGNNCEQYDHCISNPCENGGTCTIPTQSTIYSGLSSGLGSAILLLNNVDSYICSCLSNFTGKNCEVKISPCSSMPCMNNGECVNEPGSDSYRCLCPLGYTGDECQHAIVITTPYFNGQSYLNITFQFPNNGSPASFEVMFHVKTTSLYGLIHFVSYNEEQYTYIGLEEGIVVYQQVEGSTFVEIIANSFPVSDGNWHSVKLVRLGVVASLQVDNATTYTTLFDTDILQYPAFPIDLFFGGVPDYSVLPSSVLQTSGIIGCIDIPSFGEFPNSLSRGVDVTECPINVCTPTVCLNHGLCLESTDGTTYTCMCQFGFTGNNCENEIVITVPHFSESSYLLLSAPQNPIQLLLVKLNIQITTKDGLVLFAMGSEDDYISISIKNGSVVFNFNIGADEGETISMVDINDMQWHDITVGWDGIDSYVAVDGTLSEELGSGYSPFFSINPFAEQLNLTSPLFIGGVTDFSILPSEIEQTKGFQGCITEISINNETLAISSGSGSGQVLGVGIGTCPESIVSICDPNPCRFGGICNEFDDRTFVCTCPLGTGGRLCDEVLNITVPSFSSASTMAFPALSSNFSVTISVTFFPTEQNGVLLFSSLTNNDLSRYILVALLNSHILYVFDTGSGEAVINSTSTLGLYEWHTVTVTLTGHTGALQVNGNPTLSVQAPGVLSSVTLNSFLWLGGYPSHAVISNLIGTSSGFSGCISNVLINDQELDLIMDAEMGYGVGECNRSVCQNNPCRNGATCLDMSNSYVCECPDGFIGPLCGFLDDPCANPFMCINGGTCQPSAYGQPNCLCPLNKGGDFCEQDIIVDLPQFEGSSFLEYDIPSSISIATTIQISFLPTTSTGLILYIGGSSSSVDFLSLVLLNGRVQLRYDLGSGPVLITSNIVLALDQWHTVEVTRKLRDSILVVDSSDTVTGMSSGSNTQLNPIGSTFVGGVGSYEAISAFAGIMVGFSGCISSLQFNDDPPLGLVSDALSARDISQCTSDPCYTQPCLNGGTCLTLLEGYNCICVLGFTGNICQNNINITWPQFSGFSYLEFQPISNPFAATDIYLEVRPSTLNGLLLYSAQDDGPDFISLTIKNGLVEFQYNLGSGPAVITSTVPLTLEDWHTIEASRAHSIGYLVINDSAPVYGSSQGGFTSLQIGGAPLYLGGIPDLSSLPDNLGVAEGFSGCIREFKATKVAIDLIGAAVSGAGIDHCSGIQSCAQHPCLNNGTCVDTAPGYYVCLCLVGFTGITCADQITACPAGLPCQNGAQCQVRIINSTLEEYCDCSLPFAGDQCEERVEFEEAGFSGDGYLELSLQTVTPFSSIVKSNRIELSVIPSSLEGLLFYMGPSDPSYDDHLYFGLTGGVLWLKYQLGSGYGEIISTESLEVGQPYNITVERIEKMAKLEVSGQISPPIILSAGQSRLFNLDPSRFFIYLGGSPNVTLTSSGDFTSGFNGCVLSEVRLGPTAATVEPIPFSGTISGQSVTKCSIS